MLARRARIDTDRLGHREFADGRAMRAEMRAVLERRVVMAQHRDARHARGRRQARTRRRHFAPPSRDPARQRREVIGLHPAAPRVFRDLHRIIQLLHDAGRVVVEAQQMHRSIRDAVQRVIERIEVVGLEAQMHAQVGRGLRARRRQRRLQRAPCGQRPQPRFPGQRDTQIGGGDARRDELRRRIAQREPDRQIDAGARLQLPLMRIAMDVDQPRQHQEP